jgi:hypothetical protein
MPQFTHAYINNKSGSIPDTGSTFFVYQRLQNKKTEPIKWETFSSTIVADADANAVALPFENRITKDSNSFFIIYILIIGVWAFYYQKNSKGLLGLASSFSNNNVLFQESNNTNGLITVGTFLIGIISLSIFSYFSLEYYSTPLNQIDFLSSDWTILFIGFSFVVWFFLKTIIILISSWVFQSSDTFTSYLNLNVLSVQILGFLIFPLIVLINYGQTLNSLWIVMFGGVLISMTFIYRLFRTFFLGVKQTNSQWFHIILYICALEILPLLVISRVLLG